MMKPNYGVHASHCWQNQYPDGCKYGAGVACPARPKVWPHPTYDENGRNIWVLSTGDICSRPGRAWGSTDGTNPYLGDDWDDSLDINYGEDFATEIKTPVGVIPCSVMFAENEARIAQFEANGHYYGKEYLCELLDRLIARRFELEQARHRGRLVKTPSSHDEQ